MANLQFFAILALLVCGSYGKKSQTQSLDGTAWIGRDPDNSHSFPATVPGGIYTDLMRNNIIGDIFFGYGDNTTKWVGTTDWIYTLNFAADEGLLDHDQVHLVLEGVDTFAKIEVNDQVVGETNNMFVRFVFNVKDALKAKENNTLKLSFTNPIAKGAALNEEQLKSYRVPYECPPNDYHGDCHINMMRKMQAAFSWDWGPSFPSVGLWKSVYLQAFDETVIRHVVPRVQETQDGDSFEVSVDTYFAENQRGSVEGTLSVKITVESGQEISHNFDVNEKANENGEIIKTVSFTLYKDLIRLWWPNGYGQQPLYELEVAFSSSRNADDVVSKKVRTGFRTVALVQDALEKGATFYLRVNGVPIFAKGSNEIPINILPELGYDRESVKYLLQSCKDVNMNMLRVWGGGVYESDYFYELADELGILIWQDFMFACSMYPATDDYLSNVVAEVRHNVRRLYHHPSIVVYAGNNENEGALIDNWYGTADNFTLYKADYVKLYIDTIMKEFLEITGGQGIFVASSPSNGNLTVESGYIGESPGNRYWGDVHFYEYVLNPWDSNTYPIPRFCSEFGYQSLPLEDTLRKVINDDKDLRINSAFMNWRQHHPEGNGEMALLAAHNLKFPDETNEHYSSAFVYLSDVNQAQAIKTETEHYRRYRSILNDIGEGYTMGALYWQLNDVWAAPSWSSIDFHGNWKMLHYFAKDFFADIIVTGHLSPGKDQLQLYTVNDKLSPVENVNVVVRLYKYDSPDFRPLYEENIPVTLEAASSQLIQNYRFEEFLPQHNCDVQSCFFYFVIQKNASLTDSTAISPENYFFPGKLWDSVLPNSTVEITSVKQTGDVTFEITVSSDNLAYFVWLESHLVKGRFSENGFLQTEDKRKVYFTSTGTTKEDDLRKSLSVVHLRYPKYI